MDRYSCSPMETLHKMRIKFLIAGALVALASQFVSSTAFSDEALINDVERLRDSLPTRDLKGRQSLGVRIADLLFNEITKVSSQSDGSAAIENKVVRYRNRAVSLYQEALAGQNGKVPVPVDPQKTLMEYRLSRLYADQGQDKKAKAIWKSLIHRTEYPDVASEAAMSLGEAAELENSAGSKELAYECYDVAIRFGKDHDAVAYSHYRRAWLLRNDNRIPESIAELKLSLYDSKGHVREETLKDLITFTAINGSSTTEAIPYFQTLAEKLGRKELLQQLAEAYFAAGNKPSGVLVLAEVNRKNPSIATRIRLLEEFYGQRKWEDFRNVLGQLNDVSASTLAAEDGKALEATMRRLGVQLDAERKTEPAIVGDFIAVTDLYLRLFPSSELRFKMVEGSLAAETDPSRKIERINSLLENKALPWTAQEIAPMREQLVSLYQKQGDHKGVVRVLTLLIADSKSPVDVRRFKFVKASALFDLKSHEDSTALFAELVKENPADKIGVKSQLSLVKMLGRDKKFDQILSATETWLPSALGSAPDAEKSADLKVIAEIRDESEFQWAAGLGKDPKALAVFKKACLAGKFLPKSCENTTVLALQLEDHPTYIMMLQRDKKDGEIASYHEEIGQFQDAARAQEAQDLKKDSPLTAHLKIALLFEIAGDIANRDRLLKATAQSLSGKKFASGPEEDLVYLTLRDAKLITAASLTSLPWSESRKCYLSNKFEEEGQGTEALRKILLACKPSPGAAWSKLVLAQAQPLAEKPKKITFYTGNSKKKFEQRIAAIKVLNQYIETWFPPADSKTRISLGNLGKEAYETLAAEIINSPVAKMPTDEEDAAVKNSLTQMAAPFADRAKEFEKLLSEVPKEESAPVSLEKLPSPIALADMLPRYKALSQGSKRKEGLAEIQNIYEKAGQVRIASYFKGRVAQADASPTAH